MRTPHFLIPLLACLLTGCATLFHGKPELEIIGPPNMEVRTMSGGKLQSHPDDIGTTVYLNRMNSDSVKIGYNDKWTTVEIVKNPSAWELLDIPIFISGFAIDDLSSSWFNYAPVYVSIDSSSKGPEGITATTSNWLGERTNRRDVRLLILGGLGFAYQMAKTGGVVGTGANSFPTPIVAVQGGFGVDFQKRLELFYLARADNDYVISQDGGPTSNIFAQDVCLRYFFGKNLFVQGSYGWDVATNSYYTNYDYDYRYYTTYVDIPPTSTSFTEAGVAIGWAGDISYISLQYFSGLKGFDLPFFSDIRYHTLYLNFGMNLLF